MAIKRVTMQDIADACGLSRNTVSKTFNNRGSVPNDTKKLVYAKALELGYNQLPPSNLDIESTTVKEHSDAPISKEQSITVLSNKNPLNHNFGAYFIKSFTDQICRLGYTVKLYEISTSEIEQKSLPSYISLDNTSGILCIELFDKDFLNEICSLGFPTIIVDGNYQSTFSIIPCDYICMENIASTKFLVEHLIEKGASKIGFIGDIYHCNSFYERWNGFRYALHNNGLHLDKKLCILENDLQPYNSLEWLSQKLDQMPYLPDAFFCVNDYHAIHIINILKRKGLRIPEDIMVCGFDNSPESNVIDPSLTTASIPSSEIGIMAADILQSRIANPNRPNTFTYVNTTPLIRESTSR